MLAHGLEEAAHGLFMLPSDMDSKGQPAGRCILLAETLACLGCPCEFVQCQCPPHGSPTAWLKLASEPPSHCSVPCDVAW
ncbi:hypothetical protein DUNSADRAFT_371 [Dunaliella salina]|uniref:Uncharacterized protein n=1 Tax=Dunaliella salina TaxID=3046 RepID=A0ABQ7GYC5_DUNSA|nr:hypothetical protein DUNSADRAFT_371 [Dunaliella salina]|eukprot:KAF5839592.1 hypothetical protein DUNSADRAFT_371 [Dunaliella salina]